MVVFVWRRKTGCGVDVIRKGEYEVGVRRVIFRRIFCWLKVIGVCRFLLGFRLEIRLKLLIFVLKGNFNLV